VSSLLIMTNYANLGLFKLHVLVARETNISESVAFDKQRPLI